MLHMVYYIPNIFLRPRLPGGFLKTASQNGHPAKAQDNESRLSLGLRASTFRKEKKGVV